MKITNEHIQLAKEKDMIEFLAKEEGFTFKKKSSGFICEQHDSFYIQGDRKRWYWNSKQTGGNNVIDYLMSIKGYDFLTAVKHCIEDKIHNIPKTNNNHYPKIPTHCVTNDDNHKILIPPQQSTLPNSKNNYSNIIAYLNRTRCIDINIINDMICRKLIYQGIQYYGYKIVGYDDKGTAYYQPISNDSKTDDYNNVVLYNMPHNIPDKIKIGTLYAISSTAIDERIKKGSRIYKNQLVVAVNYDDKGTIKYATYRTTQSYMQYRGEAIGSDKKYGFVMPGVDDKCIYVFESFIDAMSHANLYNIKYNSADAYKIHTRLSLGGTSDVALFYYLQQHPSITKICLCLDNDNAGQSTSKKIQKELQAKGYIVFNRPPSEKDYNDDLKKIKTIVCDNEL